MACKKFISKNIFMVLLFFVALISKESEQSLSSDIAAQINNSPKSLSRRKRYLIFPEGSSLQLVYCVTIPIIGYATIFTIGGTASLAWELPHEPYKFHRRKHGHLIEEKMDKIKQKPSGGWTLKKTHGPMYYDDRNTTFNPFLRKYTPPIIFNAAGYNNNPILNSAAYRQSIRRKYAYHHPAYQTIKGGDYFKSQKVYNEPVTSYLDPIYRQVHKRTKRDLYSKIEKFFAAQSKDGKSCLLKFVCEVSKASEDNSGTFMQEIFKAIFRSKPNENDDNDDEYDKAYNKQHNCTEKYPECSTSSIWNVF